MNTFENYHSDCEVEKKGDLIYVDGLFVGHIDEHNNRNYWKTVLKEQNENS